MDAAKGVRVLFSLSFLVLAPLTVWADLMIQKEVVVSPKTGPVTANIGSVGRSCDIEMREAEVDIAVGNSEVGPNGHVVVKTQAVFIMRNTSGNKLALTVGFPISNSKYSAFKLRGFEVSSNKQERSVFNRITGYPNRVTHTWISGPESTADAFPDSAHTGDLFGNGNGSFGGPLRQPSGREDRPLGFGEEVRPPQRRPNPEPLTVAHNLMVWTERFDESEERTIEVRYAVEVPIQENKSLSKAATSNEKGIWRDEANNCSGAFLKNLGKGRFYFFDYFLTSGASWKGPIGSESIRLHLPEAWSGRQVFCSQSKRLKQTDPLTWTYRLTNEEPKEDLYFALPQRG